MFGRSVAAHRRRAGLTQEDLAARTGISVRSIREIEAGRVARPRRSTVRLLADAFGLTGVERDRFGGAADPGPTLATPAQLPLDVPAFAGREEELARLDEAADRPAVVVLFAVAGMAGVGKTALALHWAHRVRDRFPDGQLYVNLRGFDAAESVVDPADALRGFLEALDVPFSRIPTGLDARAGLFRSLLGNRRMLLVLDNARDAAQVRPLLPGSGGCVVVVTSRDRLAGLVAAEGALPVGLDVLSGPEAAALLAGRLGADRLAAEPEATAEIIAATARLPLALTIVAARVALYPAFPLAAFAAELRPADRRLEALADGHVRGVFSWSYLALTKDAARLFRLLGLHPGPDLPAGAAAALAGLPAADLTPQLAELTRLHLLTEHAPGRYAFHDLLRAYAAELAGSAEEPADRDAARERLFDHYLHTAYAAAVLLQPQWTPITPADPLPGTVPEPVPDHDSALAYFTAESQVLTGAVRLAAETGFETYAWQLAWTLASYFAPRGHWQDSVTVQRIALRAARHAGDRLGEATASRLLSRAELRLGDLPRAEELLRAALDLYGRLDDPTGQAQTLHNLAELCQVAGRTADAFAAIREALRLYRVAGYRPGEARTLNGLAWLSADAGDYAEAVARGTEALAVQRAIGDQNGQAATLDTLALAYHRMGDLRAAAGPSEQAVELFHRSADRFHEAGALVLAGDIRSGLGDPAAAADAWQRALLIYEELGDPSARDVRRRLDPLLSGP